MSNFRLVRNTMFNAKGIRNTDVTVKEQYVYFELVTIWVPKHTARLRNTRYLHVVPTKKSSDKVKTIKRRRTPHKLHAGVRVHRLPYGSKWHQRGRHAA